MTVRLLVDWRNPVDGRKYKVGNLLTTDAGTETGLVSANLADSNLTGGTAYVEPQATTGQSAGVLETHMAEHAAMGAAVGSSVVTYDSNGRVATYGQWTITYDATTGRAASQTNGVKTQAFVYDSAGRYTGYVES